MMNKKLFRLSIIFITLHIIFRAIPDFLIPVLSNEYEAIATLFTIVAFIYELPVTFMQHLLGATEIKHGGAYHFILTYLIGSIFYFLFGFLITYIKRAPQKAQ